MSKSFNKRAFTTLIVFIFFCVIAVTSILMFIHRHNDSIAMLHTLVGFSLLLVVFFYIRNNLNSFKQYLKNHSNGTAKRVNIALPIAILLGFAWIALCLLQFPIFRAFYDWGNILREGNKSSDSIQFTYTRVDKTETGASGNKLTIDLRKGIYFHWPQYAIWLETLDGELIQPLYVTEKLARNQFSNKAIPRDKNQVFTSDPFSSKSIDIEKIFTFESHPETANQRMRPESLPVFLHKLGSQTNTGNKAIDAYSGATILNNFLLSTRTTESLPDRYKVRFEINQSFDFNEFYSSNRFPDDPVYSGNGYSAQPSVIYEAIIDNRSTQHYYPMTLIGHGHYSGQNGQIYNDMQNLTTALQIVDRIIVEVNKD